MFDLLFDWLGDLLDMGDTGDVVDDMAAADDAADVGDTLGHAGGEPKFGTSWTIGQTPSGEDVIWSTGDHAGGEAVTANGWKPVEEISKRTGTA